MFELIFHPGTEFQQRMRFNVSEADLEDAFDRGMIEHETEFQHQMSAAAVAKVANFRVCTDTKRIAHEPWVLLHDGKIVCRNQHAAAVTEADLE